MVVPGGTIGNQVRSFLDYAFGWGSFIAPVVLGAFVATALRSRLDATFEPRRPQIAGWLLIFVAVVTLFQAADPGARPAWGLGRAGGWLGWLVWQTLSDAFGSRGALLLAVALGLAAVGLLFDLTIEDVWSGAPRALRWAAETLRSGLRSTVNRPNHGDPGIFLDDVDDDLEESVEDRGDAIGWIVCGERGGSGKVNEHDPGLTHVSREGRAVL